MLKKKVHFPPGYFRNNLSKKVITTAITELLFVSSSHLAICLLNFSLFSFNRQKKCSLANSLTAFWETAAAAGILFCWYLAMRESLGVSARKSWFMLHVGFFSELWDEGWGCSIVLLLKEDKTKEVLLFLLLKIMCSIVFPKRMFAPLKNHQLIAPKAVSFWDFI